MPEFSYSDLLPLGQDATSYQRLSSDGVTARSSFGRNFLEIEPQVLTRLTSAAMRDIAHLLRPAHLRQLRSILDDRSWRRWAGRSRWAISRMAAEVSRVSTCGSISRKLRPNELRAVTPSLLSRW